MKPRRSKFEIVSNLLLLEGNLQHIAFELSRTRPSFFRVARESHLALLRSMVEALRGTANLAIVGYRKKDRTTQYRTGNQPWQEIHRSEVIGCEKAWRFSSPCQSLPPTPPQTPKQAGALDQHLVGFYDLLAMIQADCFMVRTHLARSARIDDQELREIEWLHENIRNEFEHYIPKSYYVDTPSLISASHLALRITHWLLRDSCTVLNIYIPRGANTRLSRLISRLHHLMA